MYDGILAFVQASEEKIVRHTTQTAANVGIGLKVPITQGDIAFLVEEIYKARSAITNIPTKLVLVRWRKPNESTLLRIGEEGSENEQKSSKLVLSDLVCMTKDEATRHQKEILHGDKGLGELYDAETIETVEKRLREIQAYEKYR